MNHKRTLLQCALALAALPLAFGAAAQDFPPKKPVTLVVGFAAGGAADAAARLIAKKLGENIGQSVVVVLIAASRIWLEAHFASDVLAGVLLGLAILGLAIWALERGRAQL